MAETKKVTKREYYAMIKPIVADSTVENRTEILNFIDHEVELLDRKSNRTGQTKTQKQNEGIKANIKTILAEYGEPMTVAQIMEKIPYNSQKITALLNQMGEKGTQEVVRTEVKGKAYYAIA